MNWGNKVCPSSTEITIYVTLYKVMPTFIIHFQCLCRCIWWHKTYSLSNIFFFSAEIKNTDKLITGWITKQYAPLMTRVVSYSFIEYDLSCYFLFSFLYVCFDLVPIEFSILYIFIFKHTFWGRMLRNAVTQKFKVPAHFNRLMWFSCVCINLLVSMEVQ